MGVRFVTYNTEDSDAGFVNIDSRGTMKPFEEIYIFPESNDPAYVELLSTNADRLVDSSDNGNTSFVKVSDWIPEPEIINKFRIVNETYNEDTLVESFVPSGVSINDTCYALTMAGTFIVCYKTDITYSPDGYTTMNWKAPSVGIYMDINKISDGYKLITRDIHKINSDYLPIATKKIPGVVKRGAYVADNGSLGDLIKSLKDAGIIEATSGN